MSLNFQRCVQKLAAAISPALISVVRLSSPALIPVTTYPAAKQYGFRFAHSKASKLDKDDVQSKAAHQMNSEDGGVFEFVHYSSHQTILLVGEGNFSFALCLAKNLKKASKIVATALDSEDELKTKYPKDQRRTFSNALENISCIKSKGAKVLLGVDATQMASNPSLRFRKFDRIIFNLPLASFTWQKESDPARIRMHQDLVIGFFQNASRMVKHDGGEIHLMHQTDGEFANLGIEEIANKSYLKLNCKAEFSWSDYPGYVHVYGDGPTPAKSFKLGACYTFMFELKGERGSKFVHFSTDQTILLVGEGNFSFAYCLAKNLNDVSKIVATALDSEDDLRNKYSDSKAIENIRYIESCGAKVLLEVDAKTMAIDPRLDLQVFDRIVFNLPQAGEVVAGIIGLHQDLVSGFFGNATKMLNLDGEIHLTLQTTEPIAQWGVEELATKNGFRLLRKFDFMLDDYHGYQPKCGYGPTLDKSFTLGPCITYVFGKE